MKNELAGDLSLAEGKNQYDDKVKRVLSIWELVKKLQSQTQE